MTHLTHTFTARFEDGHIIEQTPDDVSVLEPETRSAYFDVQEYEKTSPLTEFLISGNGHVYGVSLTDGHFEVDGVPFFMHEEEELVGFRLIYFRRHRHQIEVGKDSDKELSHDIVHRFGWQVNDFRGKNYQEVMQLQ